MAFHLYEDTWETSATVGAGDYALGGAVAGWRPFSVQYADGDTTWYSAFDGVNFEHGIGTYHHSPNTLTRTTVLRSTNGGAAVAWGAGVKQVTVAPLGAVLEQVAAIPFSAQRLDLGKRLSASGTTLNALAPLTAFNNQSAASVNPALDAAMNFYSGGTANYEWDLPAAASGLCLGILLTNIANGSCTIRPAGGDFIAAPGSTSYTNASPLVIKPGPPLAARTTLIMIARAGAWDFLSVSSEIAEAMGWVSHPYLYVTYGAALAAIGVSTWTKISMDTVKFDSHGWWDAANTHYVPKRAGKYLVQFDAELADVGATAVNFYTAIYQNAGNVAQRFGTWNGVNYLPGTWQAGVKGILQCNGSTDYIEPWVYISGNSPAVQGGGGNSMIITYLGP